MCVHAQVYVGVRGVQKMASGSLDLEVQRAMYDSPDIGAGNRTSARAPGTVDGCLSHLPSLSSAFLEGLLESFLLLRD